MWRPAAPVGRERGVDIVISPPRSVRNSRRAGTSHSLIVPSAPVEASSLLSAEKATPKAGLAWLPSTISSPRVDSAVGVGGGVGGAATTAPTSQMRTVVS